MIYSEINVDEIKGLTIDDLVIIIENNFYDKTTGIIDISQMTFSKRADLNISQIYINGSICQNKHKNTGAINQAFHKNGDNIFQHKHDNALHVFEGKHLKQ